MILDLFKLDNKVAIVTGAGKGIGAATAQALADIGAKVVCVARTLSDVESTAESIRGAGGSAVAVAADVTTASGRTAIVEATAAEYGIVDVLVNNAGGMGHGPTAAIHDEQFYQAMQVNFMAPVYLTRELLPMLAQSEGAAVVNISSGFAKMAAIGSIPYAGAKAAQEQSTRMLAMEYRGKLRVNAIRVGAITTDNMKQNLLDVMPGIGDKLAAWTPVGRLGHVQDIAAAVVYLASPASAWSALSVHSRACRLSSPCSRCCCW